jgi:hypothetical protein
MGISKQMQMEELDRIRREEYDPNRKFDNDELVEVIENLQKESKQLYDFPTTKVRKVKNNE